MMIDGYVREILNNEIMEEITYGKCKRCPWWQHKRCSLSKCIKDDELTCQDCKKWETCECGKSGHESGTSIGYSVGECRDFEVKECDT